MSELSVERTENGWEPVGVPDEEDYLNEEILDDIRREERGA